MKAAERIREVQSLMEQKGIHAYIVLSDDFHASEYVGDYFKCREFMTGFTGSAGTCVILKDQAYLWTDGRYFLQAEEQLKGTPIRLMKARQPDVPEIEDFLAEQLDENSVIGFDGRTVSMKFVQKIAKKTDAKQIRFDGSMDLVGSIWKGRPPMAAEPVWELGIQYAGLSREEKLHNLRQEMKKNNADFYVGAALDEIAWLMNLRGNDIPYSPVFLAYLLVSQDGAALCACQQAFSDDIQKKLLDANIRLAPYSSILELIQKIPAGKRVLYDAASISYSLYESFPEGVQKVESKSPAKIQKAKKTPEEISHLKAAHIRDGVAVCRFIYWLKKNVGKEKITELSAAAKLLQFRSQMEGFLEQSFAPIIAYGPHGAIVHYEPKPESDMQLKSESFCLADTGGHYLDGTTDITRTIALGKLTEEEKRVFTLALRGHLNLGAAKFVQGISGANLDCLAREPLWEAGLDYNHGTGHGVGYLLNVHEGPQNINWRITDHDNTTPFETGMVVSNEPGVYLEGKFGVRHENLMLCCNSEKNEYGQFLHFENLTMVPFDRDAIQVSLMRPHEIERLNAYHQEVYANIAPYLDGEELEWLRSATAPLP